MPLSYFCCIVRCHSAPRFLAPDVFAFAFPHPINLAEAGEKIDDKRIGRSSKQAWLRMVDQRVEFQDTFFRSEMMPINYELRFMLVKTLRKVSSCKHCAIESLIPYRILKVMKYQVSV